MPVGKLTITGEFFPIRMQLPLGKPCRNWPSSDQNWAKLPRFDYTNMGSVAYASLTAHARQKNLPGVPFMLYSRRLRPAALFTPEDR